MIRQMFTYFFRNIPSVPVCMQPFAQCNLRIFSYLENNQTAFCVTLHHQQKLNTAIYETILYLIIYIVRMYDDNGTRMAR